MTVQDATKEVPVFSIIIPAYNEASRIASCIQAIRAETSGLPYEIIVVDNNSTDTTRSIAEQLGVTVLSESVQGVGAARSTGTVAARGKFILHIDADTHLPPQYMAEAAAHFAKQPALACVGGQMFYYDAPWWKNALRLLAHHLLIFFVRLLSRGTIGPMGNNMTFRKDLYDKTTGFDRALKFGEDSDLCRKLHRFGVVAFDMRLHCFVSVRRFKFNGHLVRYTYNFLRMALNMDIKDATLVHPDDL